MENDRGIWHLFPLVKGVKGEHLARDQYRHDLLERIECGHFDQATTQGVK